MVRVWCDGGRVLIRLYRGQDPEKTDMGNVAIPRHGAAIDTARRVAM